MLDAGTQLETVMRGLWAVGVQQRCYLLPAAGPIPPQSQVTMPPRNLHTAAALCGNMFDARDEARRGKKEKAGETEERGSVGLMAIDGVGRATTRATEEWHTGCPCRAVQVLSRCGTARTPPPGCGNTLQTAPPPAPARRHRRRHPPRAAVRPRAPRSTERPHGTRRRCRLPPAPASALRRGMGREGGRKGVCGGLTADLLSEN